MNTGIRKLPVGIQDFEDLRTNGYLYVDKTQYVYQLATQGKPYFLSRPRRFGKSLFLSTLKAYFGGKKELFEGLAIAELETEWKQYPVMYLDYNDANCTGIEIVNGVLEDFVNTYEQKWNIEKVSEIISIRFKHLIEKASLKFGQKVVVLIDEYDKPLVNTMDKPEVNDNMRSILKGFYGVLKSADAYLRFVFLTGVTKFSKVSVFSDLNQLKDISLNEDFAGICGITQTEMEKTFMPEITALAKKTGKNCDDTLEELRNRYNGYRFSEIPESVYNPFSLLNTFADKVYRYYWFETGTPTFLAKALLEQNYDIRKLENDVVISSDSIMDYRAKDDDLIPLMYQTGYLTIKSYDGSLEEYILGFPNREVKYGFLKQLLPVFVSGKIKSGGFSITGFVKNLRNRDTEGFMTSLKAFYASIPYDAVRQEHRDEQFYQYTFYLLFVLIGQFVQTEVKSALGRADAVVKTADSIYVFEFKMDSSATAEDALQQIDGKGYLIPYTADGCRLVKIGVEFSQEERGVKRWLISS